MFSPAHIHALLSGESNSWGAHVTRGLLSLLEPPVAWFVARRNRAFDSGRTPQRAVAAPVISVGNLTTGGTGKTPLVAWLACYVQSQGKRVVLLSRGYGSRRGDLNDEARELASLLPEVPHLQHRDRVRIAEQAVREHPGSVLVLDDGFQHRRLRRDLDIVLLDATCPFGYEHILPRGLLREPVANLQRADVVILSRADAVTNEVREAIRARVALVAPGAVWAEAIHAPTHLLNAQGQSLELQALRGERVAAFSGIGNPQAFRRTLTNLGAEIVYWREFPDHYAYRPEELTEVIREATALNTGMIVCTGKDLVKLPSPGTRNVPLFALRIELRLSSGEPMLSRRIDSVLTRCHVSS
jgi:tetraacyldisaccharide 4'-kinase